MPIKQIPLTGISRRPDDAASENGSLMHCVNMCNDGAGLHMLESPTKVFDLSDGEECLFIHETANYKHYILRSNNTLVWCEEADDYNRHNIGEVIGVQSIDALGNTLCALTDSLVCYILFSAAEGDYKILGQHPEMVEMQFGLSSEFKFYPEQGEAEYYSKDEIVDDRFNHMLKIMGDDVFGAYGYIPTLAEMVETKKVWQGYDTSVKDKTFSHKAESGVTTEISKQFTDGISAALLGACNRIISEAAKKNKFVMPFFVRYAYEMFDGSQIAHSYPVLLIPNSKAPAFAIRRDYFKVKGKSSGNADMKYDIYVSGNAFCYVSDLEVVINSIPDGLSNWKDLIKGVSIYATAPIYTYDQSGSVYGWKNMEENVGNYADWDDYYTVSRIKDKAQYGKSMMLDSFKGMYADFNPTGAGLDRAKDEYPCWLLDVPMKNIEDIRDSLHSAGQFYKLASITLDELQDIKNGRHSVYSLGVCKPLVIKDSTVANLSVKDQMQDDYHSHDNIAANNAYVYNNRLNLGSVTRTLHSPINPSLQFALRNNASVGYACKVGIYIHSNSGESVVVSDYAAPTIKTKDLFPDYIFYPNRNAYKAVILWRGEKYEVQLTEHPTLEGAYWCAPLWGNEEEMDFYAAEDFPKAVGGTERELGKIYTSATDNPLYFAPQNINQVGDGNVKALCANTQSVNSYNFGYATLYAFTTKGVWGLKVSDTGGYQSVQPVTRDVITEGTMPLQLGQSIIFLADRGVLRFDINSSQAKLMSAQLDGDFLFTAKRLKDVLRLATSDYQRIYDVAKTSTIRFWRNSETRMAYDYAHGRVYFCCGSCTWVYSWASGLWSEATTQIDKALNAWPRCEFVSGGSVVSLTDNEQYTEGVIITRPIKTGGEYLAKVSELLVRGNYKAASEQIRTALFASRDWFEYKLIGTSASARLSRCHGDGYRSHIVAAVVEADDADEVPPKVLSADYLSLDMTPKQTDKPR